MLVRSCMRTWQSTLWNRMLIKLYYSIDHERSANFERSYLWCLVLLKLHLQILSFKCILLSFRLLTSWPTLVFVSGDKWIGFRFHWILLLKRFNRKVLLFEKEMYRHFARWNLPGHKLFLPLLTSYFMPI